MEPLKLALVVSITGLVFLGYLAYFIGPAHIELSELASHNGRTVVVQGEVISISQHPDVTFLNIGGDNIKVVLFDALDYKFSKGEVIEVQGTIARYKGGLEIIAEEIKLLKAHQ